MAESTTTKSTGKKASKDSKEFDDNVLRHIFSFLSVPIRRKHEVVMDFIRESPERSTRLYEPGSGYSEDDILKRTTLLNVLLASRRIHQAAIPALYQTVNLWSIRHGHRAPARGSSVLAPLSPPDHTPTVRLLLRTLTSRPELRLHVKELVMNFWSVNDFCKPTLKRLTDMVPTSFTEIVTTFQLSPRLAETLISGLTHDRSDAEVALLLCMCPNLRMLEMMPDMHLLDSLPIAVLAERAGKTPAEYDSNLKLKPVFWDLTSVYLRSCNDPCGADGPLGGFEMIYNLPALKSLRLESVFWDVESIDDIDDIDDDVPIPPRPALTASKSLRSLCLTGFPLTTPDFPQLFQAMPGLEDIKVTWYCADFDADPVDWSVIGQCLRTYCTQARIIMLSPYAHDMVHDAMPDKPIGSVQSLEHLKFFSVPLAAFYNQTKSQPAPLAELLPRSLRKLWFCGRVETQVLPHASLHPTLRPHLQELIMDGRFTALDTIWAPALQFRDDAGKLPQPEDPAWQVHPLRLSFSLYWINRNLRTPESYSYP